MNTVTLTDLDPNQASDPIDSTLAVLDYIPLVSNISGVARVIFGTAETIVGFVAFPVQLGRRVFGYKESFILNHGVANIVRGVVAQGPVISNIALYLYDHSLLIKRDFQVASGLLP